MRDEIRGEDVNRVVQMAKEDSDRHHNTENEEEIPPWLLLPKEQ